VGEEQPVQVQEQPGIQRAPVLLEQVVLGVAVAGQFLLAPVAQRRDAPVDDPLGAASVRNDDALDRGGRGDALDAGPVGEPGEQPRHLVAVERLRTPPKVDRAELGDHTGRYPPDERVEIGEAAHETP
jgi:hypothetical protein